MRKSKYMILFLALVLALTACAVPETAPTEMINEETVIPATEAAEQKEPIALEITMDNWEEYFELRSTEQVYINDSCAVTNRVFGYGVFLKEEYADRLAEDSDVSFELEYSVVWRRIMGDLTGDSYLVQDAMADSGRSTQLAQLTDFRGRPEVPEESDFYGTVAAEFAYDSEFGA